MSLVTVNPVIQKQDFYMSEAEAWDHIMPAALRLQQTFSSWQDLQTDYLIGREFWSAEQMEESGNRFRAIDDQFIHDSNSPWNVNPWTMALGVTAPLQITFSRGCADREWKVRPPDTQW